MVLSILKEEGPIQGKERKIGKSVGQAKSGGRLQVFTDVERMSEAKY